MPALATARPVAFLALALGVPVAGGGETVVPFELVKNQIVLEVHLGDRGPYSMLLDTGVDPSGLDLEVARECGLMTSEEAVGQVGGVGSEAVPLYAARMEGLRVDDLRPPAFDAAAMDLGRLAGKLGRPFHGILGYAFLRNRAVRIDYAARTVTFDPEPREPAPGSYRTALELVEDDIMPLLRELRVDGVEVPVSIDTGSSLVLELYADGARRAGIEPVGESGTITGARGDEEVARGRAGTIELGALRLADQEVTLSTGSRAGSNRQGNLGNGFLRHFVLTIDYPRGTVLVEPGPASSVRSDGYSQAIENEEFMTMVEPNGIEPSTS